MKRLSLSFYGVGVSVESDDARLLEAAEHDFSYFLGDAPEPAVRIEHFARRPDYDALPSLRASVITPRNVTFSAGEETYIDYSGRALSVYRKADNHFRVYTDQADLGHEIVYLTILARVSELLDQRGLHRIHGLGLEYHGEGALLLLPSGGGKTTMTMQLLGSEDRGLRLLSEDSPLIRKDGTLLPFPLRIGTHPGAVPAGLDPKYLRQITRMEYDAKLTIDVRPFAGRLCTTEVKPGVLLLGVRSSGREARIRKVSRTAAVRHALMDSVIGVGLFQGMEFITQRSAREIAAGAQVLASRALNNFRMVQRSEVFELLLGRDLKRNFAALVEFLEARRVARC